MTTTTLICLLVVAAIVIVWFLLADEIEQDKRQRHNRLHCYRCMAPTGALQRGICDDCLPHWIKDARD